MLWEWLFFIPGYNNQSYTAYYHKGRDHFSLCKANACYVI